MKPGVSEVHHIQGKAQLLSKSVGRRVFLCVVLGSDISWLWFFAQRRGQQGIALREIAICPRLTLVLY